MSVFNSRYLVLFDVCEECVPGVPEGDGVVVEDGSVLVEVREEEDAGGEPVATRGPAHFLLLIRHLKRGRNETKTLELSSVSLGV